MMRLLKLHASRPWHYWLIRGVANIALLTCAQVGLLAIIGAPSTPLENVPAAVSAAVAVQIFLWYLSWLAAHPKS